MSLQKDTCKLCWLPPDDADLCRKCKGRAEPPLLWKIRYHQNSSFCSIFKELIRRGGNTGIAFPEECVSCCSFLIQREPWKNTIIYWWCMQSYSSLLSAFQIWMRCGREDTLDYIAAVLELLPNDSVTAKKIVSALVAESVIRVGPSGRHWVLESLAQRPYAFGSFMQTPLVIPSHVTEDFWGYLENQEEWWAFWETSKRSVERKIRFRCLAYKEELLARAWAPERMKSCMDEETRSSITAFAS
jgi:hypothetical protein